MNEVKMWLCSAFSSANSYTTKREKSCIPKGSDKGVGQGKIWKENIGAGEGRRKEGRKKRVGCERRNDCGKPKKPRHGF